MKAEELERGLRERVDPNFRIPDNRGKPAPLFSPRKDPNGARIALVSSGGFHLLTDPPFDTEDPMGDPTFREIPRGTSIDELGIAHTHYDHRYVEADINCALPLPHLEKLEELGAIGEVAPRHLSFMGYCLKTRALAEETAPEAAQLFLGDGVDMAILAPT